MGKSQGVFSEENIWGLFGENFLKRFLQGMSGGIFWGECPYSRAGLQVVVSSGWASCHPAQRTDRQL